MIYNEIFYCMCCQWDKPVSELGEHKKAKEKKICKRCENKILQGFLSPNVSLTKEDLENKD